MMRTFALTVLFALASIHLNGQEPLEGFIVEKKEIAYQEANGASTIPAQNPVFLRYFFDIAQSTNLVSAEFEANFTDYPFTLQTPTRWSGFYGATTLNSLNLTFPPTVEYQFLTTLNAQTTKTSTINFGRFDPFMAFPNISNFFNAENYSVNTTLILVLSQTSGGSSGGIGLENFHNFTVFDPVTLAVVHEQSNLSQFTGNYQIPPGTLTANREYLARIQFVSPDRINEASAFNEYETQSRFIRETWFVIKTQNVVANRFAETLNVIWGRRFEQNTAGDPVEIPDEDTFTVTYDGSVEEGVSAVALHQLHTGQTFTLEPVPDPVLPDTYRFELDGAATADIQDGLFSAGLRNTDGTTASVFGESTTERSTGPTAVVNWEACQNIQSRRSFQIKFQRPDGSTGVLQALIQIKNQNGDVVASRFANVPDGTNEFEAQISANSLQPDTLYQGSIETRDTSTIGSTEKIVFRAATFTEFPVRTTPTTLDGIAEARLIRGEYFDNGNGIDAPDQPFSFTAEIVESTQGALSAASIKRDVNGAPVSSLQRLVPTGDRWQLEQSFDTEQDLDTAWPDDFYRFNVTQTVGGGPSSARLEPGGTSTTFPATQIDTTYLSQTIFDPSLPVPVAWTGFDASGPNTTVSVTATDRTNDELVYSGDLINIADDGLSGFIERNALEPIGTYDLRIAFRTLKSQDTVSFDGTVLSNFEENWTIITAIMGLAAYQPWLELRLTPEQLNDPFYTDPNSNPDGDSFSNLAEFAIDGHPTRSTEFPAFEVTSTTFGFQFERRKNYPLLGYHVEYSTDLVNFMPFEDDYRVVFTGPFYDLVEARFVKGARLFIRFDISYDVANIPVDE
ncbi:MAG: hypothetical protein AAFX93_14330 [Verrucomicrobiota bacterium]